jgi:hypothetical protein
MITEGRELMLAPFFIYGDRLIVRAKAPTYLRSKGRGERRLLDERAVLGGGLGVFWGDYCGAGYLVVGFEVQELDAHGGSAGRADCLRVDADDLAELADDHHFGGVVD